MASDYAILMMVFSILALIGSGIFFLFWGFLAFIPLAIHAYGTFIIWYGSRIGVLIYEVLRIAITIYLDIGFIEVLKVPLVMAIFIAAHLVELVYIYWVYGYTRYLTKLASMSSEPKSQNP